MGEREREGQIESKKSRGIGEMNIHTPQGTTKKLESPLPGCCKLLTCLYVCTYGEARHSNMAKKAHQNFP